MKLNLKDKKHLIVSGCSFTDGFWLADKGSWAYYLSDMLDLKLHNEASGGQGNEWICNSIIAYLMNNEHLIKDCVVGVAWSEMTRLTNPIPDDDDVCAKVDTVRPFDFDENGKFHKYKDAEVFFSDIPWCAYRTYMSIINLTSFLKLNNIPYFFIDAITHNKLYFNPEKSDTWSHRFEIENNEHLPKLGNFDLLEEDHNLRYILNPNITSKIFDKFLSIGSFKTIQDYMWKNKGKEYERLTKNNGGHPNDVASKEIAELIYKQII